jgi:hypothetical protein
MLMRSIAYLRRHHLAIIALVFAMGGTSYAATKLPKDSVGGKQIKTGAVGTAELKNKAVTLGKVSTGARKALKGQAGATGAKGSQGPQGVQGPKGDRGVTGTVDKGLLGTAQMYGGDDFDVVAGTVGSTNIPCVFANGTLALRQRVQLPQGARVNNLHFVYGDNSASDITFRFQRLDPRNPGFPGTVSGQDTGVQTGGSEQQFDLPVPATSILHTIDNRVATYRITVSLVQSTSLCGARIDYTLP